jgi:hypothetical protein
MDVKRCRSIILSAAVSALAVGTLFGSAGALACVDVGLVLAVDGSSSIDADEFMLQQQAIAASLRDAEVRRAMKQAGTVSLAVVFWGDPGRAVQEAGPVVISDDAAAERLARMVEAMPRRVRGNTGLSTGLDAALAKLHHMGCAHRAVINVSGDGRGTVIARRHTRSPSLPEVRAHAAAAGVTINALVVSNEERDLRQYFEQQVITGPGAFVMEVGSFEAFAAALRRKLVREISPTAVSHASAGGGRG